MNGTIFYRIWINADFSCNNLFRCFPSAFSQFNRFWYSRDGPVCLLKTMINLFDGRNPDFPLQQKINISAVAGADGGGGCIQEPVYQEYLQPVWRHILQVRTWTGKVLRFNPLKLRWTVSFITVFRFNSEHFSFSDRSKACTCVDHLMHHRHYTLLL